MDKFNSFYDEDIPVCRFGPGGEFITDWPAGNRNSADPIGKILKTITKIIDAAITSKLLQDSVIEKINLAVNGTELTADTENKFDINKSDFGELSVRSPKDSRADEPDAQTAPGAQTGRKLSEEPMLFNNDTGAGTIFGHKPKHGIRAYRRAKRKRTPFGQSRQGSLFEPYTESSKVA